MSVSFLRLWKFSAIFSPPNNFSGPFSLLLQNPYNVNDMMMLSYNSIKLFLPLLILFFIFLLSLGSSIALFSSSLIHSSVSSTLLLNPSNMFQFRYNFCLLLLFSVSLLKFCVHSFFFQHQWTFFFTYEFFLNLLSSRLFMSVWLRSFLVSSICLCLSICVRVTRYFPHSWKIGLM